MVPSLAESPSARPEAGVGSRLSGLDNQAKMSVSKPWDSNWSPPGSLVETGGGGIPDVMGNVPCRWAFAISFRSTRSSDRPGSDDQPSRSSTHRTYTCADLLLEHPDLERIAPRRSPPASSQ